MSTLADGIPENLTNSEVALLQERATRFLGEKGEQELEGVLLQGATMALLRLIRVALFPGGKEPDMVAIRATRELIQMGEQWLNRAKPKEGKGDPRAEEPKGKKRKAL